MEVLSKISEQQDGVARTSMTEAPSVQSLQKQKSSEGNGKKRRRRGKSKRKILKPYPKFNWQTKRRNEKSKRDQRYRAIVLSKTHAPFNNNQFLMEIHKPEPEGKFEISQTPSARTRDSSFSVDSEENYFYSLPEDEEDFLTKEFSSVYEDAQSERLANMSKNELIQEYLILEAKYDNLIKRTERGRCKLSEDEKESTSSTDRDSMSTDKDISGSSVDNSKAESIQEVLMRMKEQENQIRELTLANEKLRVENDHLQKGNCSSSEDSESDSSSTTISSSSSSCASPVHNIHEVSSDAVPIETINAACNGVNGENGIDNETPHVNGFSQLGSPNFEEHNPD